MLCKCSSEWVGAWMGGLWYVFAFGGVLKVCSETFLEAVWTHDCRLFPGVFEGTYMDGVSVPFVIGIKLDITMMM